jgi:hypothetical protein
MFVDEVFGVEENGCERGGKSTTQSELTNGNF